MKAQTAIHKHKYFLYATSFFSGMSVMAVELGASRLLAPYFSSSQVVWTVIIGTIMIAMALGNVIGGRAADKNPDPGKLYFRLLIAAIWIAAIPFFGKYLIAGVSILVALVVEQHFLVFASLVSCLIIFVFPLMLLGTVTPSLAKYTTSDLESNGKTIGTLGALNTIGSIIGTFLPTFVTIPAVGTAATFLIFSGILLLLSAIYFISSRKGAIKLTVSAILFVVLTVLSMGHSFAFWQSDLTYEGESVYNYLQVKEDADSVTLSTNVLFGVQSIKMKNRQFTGYYFDYALAAPYMAGLTSTSDGELLMLGLGTGTYAGLCTEYFEKLHIEGVEIDQKIVDLAYEYFDLPSSVDVSVTDGRAYLKTDKRYDVILVDAYQDITIPFQMSTVEFFSLVKDHLTEDGVMVVNMNMKSSQPGAINDYLCDTIRSVFPVAYTYNIPSGTNTVLFASKNENIKGELHEGIQTISNRSLKGLMQSLYGGIVERGEGTLILTDDKAPVEVLGMQVIDEIIVDQLQYYKDIFRQGNIGDILNSLS